MIFRPDLILIDGTSYIYRAFHALPPLTTSSGKPTGATRGFASMLRKLIEKYPGTKHGFAFPSRHSYKEEATKTHWKRLFNLFDRNLKD